MDNPFYIAPAYRRKPTLTRHEIVRWRLIIIALFAAAYILNAFNQSWFYAIETLATKQNVLRHRIYNEPVATRSKSMHPLRGEWDIYIPDDQSYSLFLQFENLSDSDPNDRSHGVIITPGRHQVRFYREQLSESQVLRVWVDGDEVLHLPMDLGWQRSTLRRPIRASNTFILEKWTSQNQLVLEGYRFWDIKAEIHPNSRKSEGVLLFVSCSQ